MEEQMIQDAVSLGIGFILPTNSAEVFEFKVIQKYIGVVR